MKHAVIVGHPSQDSFTMAIARAYADEARALGCDVALRDLYREGFDPRLQDGEIPRPGGFSPGADIASERGLIGDSDVFAFIYPLWFNAPPAIVVGYIQRVFGMGFGYGPIREGGNQPLLTGKRLISFSASGAPQAWLASEGGWSALKTLFDKHVASVCGLEIADHIHFGAIVSHIRPDVVERHLETTRKSVRALCGAAGA